MGRGPRRAALGALVEMSSEGMVLVDERGTIVYANAACEELLGLPPDALVGRSGFELCRPEHLPIARRAFARCLETSDVVTCDVDVRHPDGEFRALSARLLNRLEAPGINAVLVGAQAALPQSRARDEERKAERERRELEARLWQARKMEAVGNMTAGIAHDFNNILSIILANADLVASELGPTTAASHRDLEELRAAAVRGSGMIRRLLGFSRSAQLTIEPTDIAAVVNGLHPTLRHLIPDDILLEMSLEGEGTALCDRRAVEEMLLNLATNARDATPSGGTVRIVLGSTVMTEDASERPRWMTPGRFVRLSVSDNGVGMDEATKSQALKPFFTTKAPGAGTGLGLPMVYGLAKQQGGFIDVLSELGNGTTVHLYFPTAA